jgi:isoleucyl-tRNA synthetase
MGVDVMRWLYCAHKPESDLLFGYKRGDETRRQFLIPLWNVYSFLVTYANLDGWEPGLASSSRHSAQEGDTQSDAFDPGHPEGPTPQSENLLDRWILSRLNQIIPRVTEALENSDPLNATLAIEGFLDDLSNWYVRRSRRRFWKSEHDLDKNTAYTTLYHLMVKFVRLLAPFVPFVAETIYQNLVCSVQPQAYKSVHHTAWPIYDPQVIDESLLDEMALARQIASLGLSARNSVGIKVRQPLSRALAYTGSKRTLRDELIAIVTDELNIKKFEFVEQASQLVTYRILPDNQKLGPRFGAQFPKLRSALSAANPAEVAASVQAGSTVSLVVDGQAVELAPDEIMVQTLPVEGLAVAFDKQATVAVDATITPELRLEGLTREVVRRIQAMRKEAGFEIADRITTYYQVEGEFEVVFKEWSDYIKSETLTTDFVAGEAPQDSYQETVNVEGQRLVLAVVRNR